MSKVMTIHHLQRLRNRGGLVEEVREDIISGRSLLLWQSYRPVLWQWIASSTCLAISFVRGSLRFSIIESWLACLSYTSMMDMSLLQGWTSHWHLRWSHRLQGYQMWVRCGLSADYLILFTLSPMSGHHLWDCWWVFSRSDFSGVSMLPSWDLLCITLPVRAYFHKCIHITFSFWCISPE